MKVSEWRGFFLATCFSRNHKLLWCLDLMFFKRSFYRWRVAPVLLVLILCVLLCIQYFIYFVHNTTVNAQPLSPPIFDKIGPHLKKRRSLLSSWFFAFAFLCFCTFAYVCWPLPSPWPRLAPLLGECGAIVGQCWWKCLKDGCLTKPRKSDGPSLKK